MPLIKHMSLPTARMAVFYLASECADLAVVDFSTDGHGLYNYGHLLRLNPIVPKESDERIFSTHITEVDIALGDTSRLENAVREICDKEKYQNILLLPSSLACVLGWDLQGMAKDLSEKYGVNIFTVSGGFEDDFFQGQEAFYLAAVQLAEKTTVCEKTYNLLGGISVQDKGAHRALQAKLAPLGLQCNFDSANAGTFSAWQNAAAAELNIVTSRSTLAAADMLKQNFGIPYLLAPGIGKIAEDEFMHDIAVHFGGEFTSTSNAEYNFALLQTKNILEFQRTKIIVYADSDKIESMKPFFGELNVPVEMICSHTDMGYIHLSPDAFIGKYRDAESVILSYDSICREFPRSIVIAYSGLDYHLITPLYKPNFGIDGAYWLMEKLCNLYF